MPTAPRLPSDPLPAARWLTAEEAAIYLGLPSAGALYKRVERGQVPSARRFGRQFRFRQADLDALIANGT